MITLKDVRLVHVEASSRCNSHCPMCSRFTAFGEIQPELNEDNLSEETFLKLFTKELCPQLEHVYFSGVYGDPCFNKLLPKFVDYLLDNGVKSIVLTLTVDIEIPNGGLVWLDSMLLLTLP